MRDGNYLVAANASFVTSPGFISIYSPDSTTLLNKEITVTEDRLVYSTELDDGNLIHVFQMGGIYQSDAEGENMMRLDSLSGPFDFLNIVNVVEHNRKLQIICTTFDIDVFGSARFVLDLSNPVVPIQRYDIEFSSTQDIAFLNSGSYIVSSASDLAMFDREGDFIWIDRGLSTGLVGHHVNDEDEIFIHGSNNEGAFLAKLDTLGNIIWELNPPIEDCSSSDQCFYIFTKLTFLMDGSLIVAGVAFGFSAIVFTILKGTLGIRVGEETEAKGLDVEEHGAPAYCQSSTITAAPEPAVATVEA